MSHEITLTFPEFITEKGAIKIQQIRIMLLLMKIMKELELSSQEVLDILSKNAKL